MSEKKYRYPAAKIIVFAKEPVAGKVKTRLARSIGDEAALQVHQQMLNKTLEMACNGNLAAVELHVSGDPDHPLIQSMAKQHDTTVCEQQGRDLGEKMFYALENSLRSTNYSVLIGTDCPVMSIDYLASAFDALELGQEAVLGPAEDGGYVLIGARSVMPGWFCDIPWGSHQVLESSRRKMISSGIPFEELPTLWDVDRIEDLQRWELHSAAQQR